MSFVFNEDGKVSSFTGGYIMDRLDCSPMPTFFLECKTGGRAPLTCCLLLRLALSCGEVPLSRRHHAAHACA